MKFHANSDTRLTQLLNEVGGEGRSAIQDLTAKLKAALDEQHSLKAQNSESKSQLEQLVSE